MTDKRIDDNPQLTKLAGTEVILAQSIDGGTDTSSNPVAPKNDIKIPVTQILARRINTTVTSNTVTPGPLDRLMRPAALSAATTFANPGTAPSDGWVYVFDFKDDGTARALTWGSKYATRLASFPATTIAGKRYRIETEYNAADDKYYCMSVILEGGVSSTATPLTTQSSAYTLVSGDANSVITHPSSDTTARTWTIPANSSVAFAVGTMVTFDNQASAGALTIAITTDTLELVGAGTTGSRTIAAGGQATAVKVAPTKWRISGTGLT